MTIKDLFDYIAAASKEDKRTKKETARDMVAASALTALFPPAAGIKALKDNPIFAKFYRENPNKVNRAIEYATTMGAGGLGGGWGGAAVAGGLKAVTDNLPIIGSEVADAPLSVGNATNLMAAIPGGGVLGKLGTRVAPKAAAFVTSKTGKLTQQALRAAGESLAAELALTGGVSDRSLAAGAATAGTGAAVRGTAKLLGASGAAIHDKLDKVLAKLPNRAQVMKDIDPVNTRFLEGRKARTLDDIQQESMGLGFAGQAAREKAIDADVDRMLVSQELRGSPDQNENLLEKLARAKRAAKETAAEADAVNSRKRNVDLRQLRPEEPDQSLLKMLTDAASDNPAQRDAAVRNAAALAQELEPIDPNKAASQFYIRALADNATDENDLLLGSRLGKSVSSAPENVLQAFGAPSGWDRFKLLDFAKQLDALQTNERGYMRSGLRLYKQPISLNLDSVANIANRVGSAAYRNSPAIRDLAQRGDTTGRLAGIMGRQTANMVANTNPRPADAPPAYVPPADVEQLPLFDPDEDIRETRPAEPSKKEEGTKKDPSSLPEFDPDEF